MRWAVVAIGLALAASLPGAAAHGAAGPREVDTRVLLDDDGLLAFGGCVEGSCPPEPHAGLDLLSLDARELRLADGRPAIAFAVAYQWEADAESRSIRMQFMAGGQQQVVTVLAPDTDAPTVAGAEKVVLAPVGDGHARLVEAWFALPTLGLEPGAQLSEVTVQSFRGDTVDDVMPGGWYSNGAQVPHVPHSADPGEAAEEPVPGAYSMKGPAPLLEAPAPQADSVSFPRSYSLTARNPLGNLSQFVEVRATLDPAGRVRLDPAAFSLGPGESRPLNVSVGPGVSGQANLTLSSDLGGWTSFALPFIAPATSNSTTPTQAPESKDTPAPAWALPILLFAAARLAGAAGRRR